MKLRGGGMEHEGGHHHHFRTSLSTSTLYSKYRIDPDISPCSHLPCPHPHQATSTHHGLHLLQLVPHRSGSGLSGAPLGAH